MTFSPDEDDDSMQNINSPGDSSGFLGKGDTKQVVDRIFFFLKPVGCFDRGEFDYFHESSSSSSLSPSERTLIGITAIIIWMHQQ